MCVSDKQIRAETSVHKSVYVGDSEIFLRRVDVGSAIPLLLEVSLENLVRVLGFHNVELSRELFVML